MNRNSCAGPRDTTALLLAFALRAALRALLRLACNVALRPADLARSLTEMLVANPSLAAANGPHPTPKNRILNREKGVLSCEFPCQNGSCPPKGCVRQQPFCTTRKPQGGTEDACNERRLP